MYPYTQLNSFKTTAKKSKEQILSLGFTVGDTEEMELKRSLKNDGLCEPISKQDSSISK